MSVTDMFRGGGTDSRLYFAIGGISLLKALVVRGDKRRFRSELKDAALFLAVGMFLRRAEQRRTDKVADIDLLQRGVSRRLGGSGGDSSGGGSGGIRGRIRSSGGQSGSKQGRSRSLPERLLG